MLSCELASIMYFSPRSRIVMRLCWLIMVLLGYLCQNSMDKFVGDFWRMLLEVLGYPCLVDKL